MRSNRAMVRAGVSMAATLPMLAGALALGIPAAQAADHPVRALLAGTRPAWATAKADKGATSDGGRVSARVYLAGKDAAGLAAYAKAVSDPGSASYGEYLSAGKAQARFGATAAQVTAVKSWLTVAGLKVTGVTRHYVSVTGDVAAAEKAFGTRLHNFAKGSKIYRAPASAASVPQRLAGAVLTVTGLDNAPHMVTHDDRLPPPDTVFRNAGPFSSYYGSNTASTLPDAYGKKIPYAVKGYTGKQLRAAYGAGRRTGKGVRVAITDAYASPTIAYDAGTYAKRHGDAAWKTGRLTIAEPFYQKGVVPDAPAKADSADGNRVVPDIAAIADPNTGFLVGQTQTLPDGGKQAYSEYRIGGTSLAAPTIAAVQALAQEARGGKAIGFANPAIYARSGSKVYHDVTDDPTGSGLAVARVDYVNGHDATGGLATSVRSLGKDSSLTAVKGYDDVTGVGSPAGGYVESYRRH
ncbi:protease pro-enzyme activation domain-containing protein [Streptomyces sp. 378]|uniref:protease pro-enzyme activation domain-containing protein n=1 Tax=Streptomyces sp. 378 TaxID=3049412 RepID=UPI0024C3AEF2|nr:protease pro-enzyme activation domain-containing protein [Streptomyces sp. 378]MDK1343728.1 protease pro-enzyme activation domain-containing protein [Streptomyces sp. 378]